MALIRCKNCGHLISERAKVCPKCGAKNIIDKPQTPYENAAFSETENPANYQVDEIVEDYLESTKKSKAPYIILIIILSILLGGCIAYLLHHHNKMEEARHQEQLRQDSIAAVQLEAARLDSIRRDSIEFISFSTSDLTFFELHCKVKSVSYNSANGAVTAIFNNSNFEFDENGNLKNKKNNFNLAKPDGENLYRWEYNENGFPTKGVYAETGGYQEAYWVWNPNGQLKTAYNSLGSHSFETNYKYDKDGRLLYIKATERANMGQEIICNTTIEIVETDKWGNWLTRSLNKQISEKFDLMDGCEVPPGYKLVTRDGYTTCEKKYTKKITEKRTITYYDNR